MTAEGTIVKGIGGFYYVKVANSLITCKARGVFRRDKFTPCIGDLVKISYAHPDDGMIEEFLPRRNYLIRPPIANIDKLFIVISTGEPVPNIFIIDKTIAIAEIKKIEPILVITKTDLYDFKHIREIYSKVGLRMIFVSALLGDGIEEVRAELEGCNSAFTGNSGVGKSTLLNAVLPELQLETGEISKKLGRGRHTTRHVELFPLKKNGCVADTPGFSTLDVERLETIYPIDLPYGFREFVPYLFQCKFSSCTHTCEKGCAILAAVEEGKIHKSRFESYLAMYNDVKDVREWQIQKNV